MTKLLSGVNFWIALIVLSFLLILFGYTSRNPTANVDTSFGYFYLIAECLLVFLIAFMLGTQFRSKLAMMSVGFGMLIGLFLGGTLGYLYLIGSPWPVECGVWQGSYYCNYSMGFRPEYYVLNNIMAVILVSLGMFVGSRLSTEHLKPVFGDLNKQKARYLPFVFALLLASLLKFILVSTYLALPLWLF